MGCSPRAKPFPDGDHRSEQPPYRAVHQYQSAQQGGGTGKIRTTPPAEELALRPARRPSFEKVGYYRDDTSYGSLPLPLDRISDGRNVMSLRMWRCASYADACKAHRRAYRIHHAALTSRCSKRRCVARKGSAAVASNPVRPPSARFASYSRRANESPSFRSRTDGTLRRAIDAPWASQPARCATAKHVGVSRSAKGPPRQDRNTPVRWRWQCNVAGRRALEARRSSCARSVCKGSVEPESSAALEQLAGRRGLELAGSASRVPRCPVVARRAYSQRRILGNMLVVHPRRAAFAL